MPKISSFFGVLIYMYFDDHNPPHFHAKYNENEITIRIDNVSILTGSLPPRALGFVIEWALIHRDELLENWKTLEEDGKWNKIEPLV